MHTHAGPSRPWRHRHRQRQRRHVLLLQLAAVLCLHIAGAVEPPQQQPQLASPYGLQPNPMGYHEGARRVVACDGGHVTGFDAYMSHLGGFAEPTLNALRLICSSGRVALEYEAGSLPDTLVYGNLDAAVQPTRVMCPSGTGVAALEWRRVPGTEKETTARVAGFRVHCGTESAAAPIVVDTKVGMAYPASLKCSQTKAPPSGPKFRVTAVEVWHEQLLTGLHLISCSSG